MTTDSRSTRCFVNNPQRLHLVVVVCLLITGFAWARTPDLKFTSTDRILVLAPHPDDEVLGNGGIIQKAVARHLPIRVVFLTNGDNYEWAFMVYKKHPVLEPEAMRQMGLTRHEEALAAGSLLGLSPDHFVFLGYPDWGTETIWMEHWGPSRPAFRSMLTRVTAVPYPNSFHPGAAYKGEVMLADIEKILREFRPTKIFLSHPADGHRDHRALYLFARIALWNLQRDIQPEIFPYLIHYPHWPTPRGFIAGRVLEPPEHFPDTVWFSESLTPDQAVRKKVALEAHQTQMAKDARYLHTFVATNELFGRYPELNLIPGHEPQVVIPKGVSRKAMPVLENHPLDITWRFVHREQDTLVLHMEFSRSLLEPGETARISLFGYRRDKPFELMPKLRLTISRHHLDGHDQTRKIDVERIEAIHSDHQVNIRIPLDLLGDPEKIIGTAWSRTAEEPFDWQSWRIINL